MMKRLAVLYNSNENEICSCRDVLLSVFKENIIFSIDPKDLDDYQIFQKVDTVITLGGDGFILHTENRISSNGFNIPMIRINFGRVGFLANVKKDMVIESIGQFLDGKYVMSKRNKVMAIIDKSIMIALNDIVIERRTTKIAEFSLLIGNDMHDVRGDGIIIATRTGSTAYNRSAGGPIILDDDMFVVTRICPANLGIAPYYEIPSETVIQIIDIKKHNLRIVSDGQESFDLSPGSLIEIKRYPYPALFVELGDQY
ncbi:MAG: NAD(+)/NADH kinase [Candidatus Pacebacteria bacterium]|nr:NAD(+)/NADH kinase [Candidatus Paceibacterota bacterium]